MGSLTETGGLSKVTLDLGLPALYSKVPAYAAVCWYGRVHSNWKAQKMTLDLGLVSLSTVGS